MGYPVSTLTAGETQPGGFESPEDAKASENGHPTQPNRQQQQHSLSSIPKRKPVPQATVVALPDNDSGTEDGAHTSPPPQRARQYLWIRGHAIPIPFAGNSRKQFLIGGVVGIVLVALIIGLAVGLSLKESGPSNLPLPTSHGGPYTGDLTYYTPALGSCGLTSSSSEEVCAVSHYIFDAASVGSNPNANPLCGLKIRLRRGEKSVDVTVVDRCVGCEATDIDVSESVFADLAAMELGRVDVQWAWLQDAPVVMPG